MTTYKKAADVLTEAIKDPDNEEKLAAAKNHPRLKSVMRKLSSDDLATLNKVAKGAKIIKCTDQ